MPRRLRQFGVSVLLTALTTTAAVPANALVAHRHTNHRVAHHVLRSRGTHVHSHALGAPTGPLATPQSFVGTAGDSQATFSWQASLGADRYVVFSKPNNASCVTTQLRCTVVGLTNGTTYTVAVYALNSSSSSLPSTPLSITPSAAAPTAPQNVKAVGFGLHARVMWTLASSPSSAITSYTVTSSPGGLTCTTTSASCTVTDLSPGVAYTFSVTATNASGTSTSSDPSNSITASDRPSAPQNVTASPAPTSIGVSFDAPLSDGGSVIDGYFVVAYSSTVGQAQAWCRSNATDRSCTITGLALATTYVIRVVAHNANGYSVSASPAGSVTTGYNAPGPPLNPAASAGPEHIDVSWSAPSTDGGGAITGYTATADDGQGGTFTCVTTTLACTISGLSDGVTYSVSVVATNGTGNSIASAVLSATPGNVPRVPTDLGATAGNGSIAVSWLAPSVDGGSAITGYTATADDGNGGVFTCTTSGALTCTIKALTNGVTYTITVVATNATGDSVASASTSATPVAAAGAPTNLSVTPKDSSVSVSWSAPSNDGGTSVTAYTATADDGKGGVFTCTTTGALTCDITGLTNGLTYTISVVATNAVGDSAASASLDTTPATTPGSPTTLSTKVNDSQVSVVWVAPSDNGGSPITQYTATADDGDGGVFTCTTTSTLTCVITGLTNGVTYTITVVATNAVGDSDASSSTSATPIIVASAPVLTSATGGNASAVVSWTAPTNDGGSAITGYTATADDGDGGIFTCTTTELTCTITGLTNGVAYTVSVVATNAIGNSDSSTSSVATPMTTPDVPNNVVATAGDTTVAVSWTAPASDGGSAITVYTATADDGDGGIFTCTTTDLTCTITGLSNDVLYTISVVATNGIGDSLSSDTSTATPVPNITVPDAPTLGTVASADTALTVNWTAGADGGSDLTGFAAFAMDAMENLYSCTGSSTDTSCTITGLTNGTSYDVWVIATNAIGDSKASSDLFATPYTTPATPSSVSASSRDGALLVTWAPVTDTGGTPITGYIATALDQWGNEISSCSTDGLTNFCEIPYLTNFVTYTITVIATNAAGNSASSSAPPMPNPNVIVAYGSGWLGFDNWNGFVSSDPAVTAAFANASIETTYDFDCNIRDIIPVSGGGVYVQNNCSDIFYIAADGTVTGLGYNDHGSGAQMAIGPNGEAVFTTDSNYLYVYNYALGEWEYKYLNGSDCIDGVAIDASGNVWVSDMCRGQVGVIENNIFDGSSSNWYSVYWTDDMCNPYRLTFAPDGKLLVGSDCGGMYWIYNPATDSSVYVGDVSGYFPQVYAIPGAILPLDTNPWPHRFVNTGTTGMPMSHVPSAPQNGSVFTWGNTWIMGQWTAPQYEGLDGPVTNYTLSATGPEGDIHTCSSTSYGLTQYDNNQFICTITGLSVGVSYTVSVVATNTAGDSPSTYVGYVTTASPTVSVPSDITNAYVGASRLISQLSSSGSTISVDSLAPNSMVSVVATNGTLNICNGQWRSSDTPYNTSYWGGGNIMAFAGDAYSVNHDLANLCVSANSADLSVGLTVIVTPINMMYNPTNAHYYQYATNYQPYVSLLTFASQQSLFGLQGYMTTPSTPAQYIFLTSYASGFVMAMTDDPHFILNPVTGQPLFSYKYANNDPSTALTDAYLSDPAASFQKWYFVAGPLAGTQFGVGGKLYGFGGGTNVTGSSVNGFVTSFCNNEPNDAGMNETVLQGGSYCYNDMPPNYWYQTVVEYGGMPNDSLTASSVAVVGGASFSAALLLPHAVTDFTVTGSTPQGFTATWTTPDNANSVGVDGYYLTTYQVFDDGSEVQVCGPSWWYPWGTSYNLNCYMVYPNKYRVAIYAYNGYGNGPSSSVSVVPADARLHAVQGLSVTGSIPEGFTANWTAPDNSNDGGVWGYYFTTYLENKDGSETQVCGPNWWYPWGTSYNLGCSMNYPNTYRVVVYAYNGYGNGAESSTLVTPADASPHAVQNLSVSGNEYSGIYVSYGAPDNANVVGLDHYLVEVFLQNGDGTETSVWTGYFWPWYPNGYVGGMSYPNTYRIAVTAYNSYGATTASTTFSPADPYVLITNVSYSVSGNAVTATWTSAPNYGGEWYTQMKILDANGAYVAACSDYSGAGSNGCSLGGLALSTAYTIVIQGFGWNTGWGGGYHTTITTESTYVAGNFFAAAASPSWPNAMAMAGDGTFWDLQGMTVHHYNASGVIIATFDTTSMLPANVSPGGLVGMPDGSVVLDTRGYSSGWFDSGVLHLWASGDYSYLASSSTNCAQNIVRWGTNKVVVSNFYGLTVIDLTSGESYPLPGLSVSEQMYATVVPSDNGQVYFLDRYDATILHHYLGVDASNKPIYADTTVSGYSGTGYAVIGNSVVGYQYNPSYDAYTLYSMDLTTTVITTYARFQAQIGTPTLVGVGAAGTVMGWNSPTLYAFVINPLT